VKVGIIQSCYIPWRGYFDFIDEVDLFIFHDDLQYTKGNWRNRNQIKTTQGLTWLTVPVHYDCVDQTIEDTTVDYTQAWQKKHLNQLRANYGKSPYWSEYAPAFEALITPHYLSISALNVAITKWVAEVLAVRTPLQMSKEFAPTGSKTERLIGILKKAGANSYLSGPTAKGYLDHNLFKENNIRLEYKSYEYPPYAQMRDDFIGNVTVLDLLFNCGPDSRKYLKSLAPNEVVT